MAAFCREMTKKFETVLRGSLAGLRSQLEDDPNQRKGEFVLVLSGCEHDYPAAFGRAVELASALQDHLTSSQAARVAAKVCGVSRRELYNQLTQE